ncbi:hypothetical protein L1049_020873 [Liquidambar formosana]|uniref:Carboxypeptidase n=1 Tax=Liquidambar formosana TaxID=63359 RepID=A0AAP0SDC7_LIQFO
MRFITAGGDSPSSVLPVFRELISAGYRIWVFSGDTDSVVPLTSTRNSMKALHLETLKEWSAWWMEPGLQGPDLLTVRGAGHEVPLYRP